MPTLLSQNFSLVVQDRDAKSAPSEEPTIVDMSTLQPPPSLLTTTTTTTPDTILKQEMTIPQAKEEESTQVMIQIPAISIWTAAEQGDVATLTQYIQRHPYPSDLLNKRDPKTECTLLHLAITSTNDPYAILQCLLTHGANPCARNIYNIQALHTLPLHCTIQPKECIALLLDHQADIHGRDGDGWTPLHYAMRFCPSEHLLEVVDYLVQRGADCLAIDSSQKTPLFGLLANGDHPSVLAHLLPISGIWQARGEFLDPVTRRSYRGTLVLQAAKYLRIACLDWIVQTPKVLDELLPVLTRQELDLAMHWVQQEKDGEVKVDMVSRLSYLSTLVAPTRESAPENPIRRLVRFLSRHKKPIDNEVGRSIVV